MQTFCFECTSTLATLKNKGERTFEKVLARQSEPIMGTKDVCIVYLSSPRAI